MIETITNQLLLLLEAHTDKGISTGYNTEYKEIVLSANVSNSSATLTYNLETQLMQIAGPIHIEEDFIEKNNYVFDLNDNVIVQPELPSLRQPGAVLFPELYHKILEISEADDISDLRDRPMQHQEIYGAFNRMGFLRRDYVTVLNQALDHEILEIRKNTIYICDSCVEALY